MPRGRGACAKRKPPAFDGRRLEMPPTDASAGPRHRRRDAEAPTKTAGLGAAVRRRIGLDPLGGRARDDLEAGLRTVPFEHTAVIAYTVEDDCVRVTNIFYGGRDYEALYRKAPESQSNEGPDKSQ